MVRRAACVILVKQLTLRKPRLLEGPKEKSHPLLWEPEDQLALRTQTGPSGALRTIPKRRVDEVCGPS